MAAINKTLPFHPLMIPYKNIVTMGLFGIGMALILSGVYFFRRQRTTINPVRPETASALVTGGIYRHTRNPMYAGLLFVLIGWGIFLGNPLTIMGLIGFYCYMNQFQIRPEEKALSAIFGDDFTEYCQKVRRWL